MRILKQSSAILLLLALWIGMSSAVNGQDSKAPPVGAVLANIPTTDEAVLADFQQRVKGYLDVVRQTGASVPKEKSKQSIDNLDKRRKELAAQVKAARASARQGDLFSPAAASVFRRLLAETMAGPHGHRIRESLQHAEPIARHPLEVNETYPRDIPLQSTPPTLLLNLPPLPKGLEYRVIDHALLLRDTEANTIADFLPDAFPKDLSK